MDVPMTDCDSQPKTAAPERALSTQHHCPQLSPLLHWLRGPRAPLLIALMVSLNPAHTLRILTSDCLI